MTTLYRKYRPQTFSDVVGQKHIVTTLENALRLGKVGQAYLFTGPRGTGKTTLARIFAKAVNCLDRKGAEPCGKCEHCILMSEGRSLDIIEIDAASHTGVDNIRELRETIALPPSLGSHKIYIIDEVHMLSAGAWNALLKTLEEPPRHALFILATTALHKIPDTILSRCQRFDLSRFPIADIVAKLEKIAKEEKFKIEKGALEMIALAAEGGMRDAESLLTQISSLGQGKITEAQVIEILGTARRDAFHNLLSRIAERDLPSALAFVRTLSQDGRDLSVFLTALIHYLRDLLLVSAEPERGLEALPHLSETDKSDILLLAQAFSPNEVVSMLEILQIAQRESKNTVILELPLEIAVVKIITLLAPKTPPLAGPGPQPGNPGDAPGGERQDAPEAPSQPQKETRETPKKSQTKTATTTKNTLSETETSAPEKLSFSIEDIREHWQRFLGTAKDLNASLSLALSTAEPRSLEDNFLVIAVRYPFHKERLDEAHNQLTLMEAFDRILGTKIRLRVIVAEGSQKNSPRESLSDNPLISQAMSMLGGRIAESV